MAKRIGLDCRLVGTKHTGIGRYILALVPELVRQAPPDYHWILFVADKDQEALFKKRLPEGASVEIRPAPIRHYSLAEQLILPFIFIKAKLDLLHVPHFNTALLYPKKTVLTVHDLLWHKQTGRSVTTLPPWLYRAKHLAYRLVVAQATERAKAILVPSKQTKKDLLDYKLGLKPKIHLTYEGVLLPKKVTPPDKLPPKDYLLYVGSLYPHKNVRVLLQALALTPKENLVIVSARNIFQQEIKTLVKRLKLTSRVIFFDWLNDARLGWLYKHAKALVQPSLHEGFGLTGIEALSYNTPVIASDIPVFHEVYQDVARFFPPKNPQKLAKLIGQDKKRLKKTVSAKKLLKRYNWSRCANKTLAVYEKVLQT